MTSEQRVRAAIVDLVDSYDMGPGPGLPARGSGAPAARGGGRRVVLAGVAAAVVLVLALVAMGPARLRPRPEPVTASASSALPATLPEYRAWGWWPQAWRPLDEVAMTWYVPDPSEMTLVERPHDMLLGSDLTTVRTDDPGWTPVVSPNGRRLARLTDKGAVRIDDLSTGTSVETPVPSGGEWTDMQQWSADSEAVYVQARDVKTSRFVLREFRPDGTTRTVAQLPDIAEVAPAPDDRRIAVVGSRSAVQIVDTASARVVRTLDWDGQGTRRTMTGLQWSPDGTQILIFLQEKASVTDNGLAVSIIDVASGHRRAVRSPGFSCKPVGMLTAERVLCLAPATTRPGVPIHHAPDGLVTFDLDTGERRVVSVAQANPPIAMVSVAMDLARRWQFAQSVTWVAPVDTR